MALPTLEKTWQYAVNIAIGGIGVDDDNADTIFKIKEALIGLAGGQWSVAASSNGTTADLTDNWASAADVVWADDPSDHSWIVFENNFTGVQLCFDCDDSPTTTEFGTVEVSPDGSYDLTGLTPDNKPSATVAFGVGPAAEWGGADVGWSGKAHVMCSTDGECTRIIICRSNSAVGFWFVDKARNPQAGWTYPHMLCVFGDDISSEKSTYYYFNQVAATLGYLDSDYCSFHATSEGYYNTMLGQSPAGTNADSQTGGWLMCPIGLACVEAAQFGRKGELFDMWWGSTTRSTGDTYPSDGSYQFVQIGDLILPWNGTLPEVS